MRFPSFFARRLLQVVAKLACAVVIASSCPVRAQAEGGEAVAVNDGAVLYGVVPTLFGEDPFNAVRAKLDYLTAQGVDILWISPIQKTDDPSAISYSITDYGSIRDDFGTAADFKALVKEAKERGLKVVIDFVPNHTSSAHPYFLDARENGRSSPYYSFYDRTADGKATHYFDWEHLPNLNFENPEVTRFIFDALGYWIREYGVDGFRMDAAWGIQKRTPSAWPALIKKLTAANPRILLVAEASARDPYFAQSGFHLAYDWTHKLGRWSWQGVFDDPCHAGAKLSKLFSKNPPASGVIRFLNNNDTGRRFISHHGAGVTRVAAVLQHTVPGVALVYTGDEVGAEYEPYQDPPPISWTDRHHLQPLYRKLAQLREELPALRTGGWTEAPVSGNEAAYAYLRSIEPATENVLVLLNFGPEAVVEFALPPRFKAQFPSGSARDRLTGESKPVEAIPQGGWKVRMEAESAVILQEDS